MEILDFDPKKLSSHDAKGIAADLVDMNVDAMKSIETLVAGPALDMVINNESDYSGLYRPIIKEGVKQVAQNSKELMELDRSIVEKAMTNVQRNSGELKNLMESIRRSQNVFGTVHDFGSGFLTGHTPQPTNVDTGEPLGETTAASNPPSMSPMSVGSMSASGSELLPISGTTLSGSKPGQGSGSVQGSAFQAPASSTLSLGGNASSPSGTIKPIGVVSTGPCGPPVLNQVPPVCPPGYRPQYNVSTECWECIGGNSGGTTTPPKPSTGPLPSCVDLSNNPCPPGMEWTYTYPPGIVECHPIPAVKPQCPKPLGGCPEGSDWWNDPATGIWHCTPGGQPKPPTPKPTVPSCDELQKDLRIVLNIECKDLPDDIRKQLAKCGYVICNDIKIPDYGVSGEGVSLWEYLEPIEEALIEETF